MTIDKTDALRELEDLVESFDPYYSFSDDHTVWSKHQEISDRIHAVIKFIDQDNNKEEGIKLYHQLLKKRGYNLN